MIMTMVNNTITTHPPTQKSVLEAQKHISQTSPHQYEVLKHKTFARFSCIFEAH